MRALFSLAIFPGIALMIYIYNKDKKEKEPIGLLLGLFGLGALSVIPAAIFEGLFSFIGEDGSITGLIVKCIFVIGLFEELGKFVFLSLFSWKNKNFNCSFDGIVYSVFVSLGFATIENILYVFGNGVFVGILRAITAVPGHASFAVFMGFFYSKMRKSKANGNISGILVNAFLAILVPMTVHGIYDTLAMAGTLISFLLFVAFVIAMFVTCFIIVRISANKDSIFEPVQYIQYGNAQSSYYQYNNNSYGNIQNNNTYGNIQHDNIPKNWYCIKCGSPNTSNFCIRCGAQKY